MYMYFNPWSLPKNSTIHAVHFQDHHNDALRCMIFGVYGDGGPEAWHAVRVKIKPATGEELTSGGPLFAWTEEADQNSQIICRDDPPEVQLSCIDLTQMEQVHTKASSKIKRLGRVGLSETYASAKREASTHRGDWWKANWWYKYQQERSRRSWNDEVWEFLKGFCTCTHRTQTTNWRFFLSRWSWSDECWFFLSLDFFLDRVFRVSYTCSSNHSVFDKVCVHTLTCRTHNFLVHTHCAYFTHLHACHTHAWLKCL